MSFLRRIARALPAEHSLVRHVRDRMPPGWSAQDDVQRGLAALPVGTSFVQVGSNDGVTNDLLHRVVRWRRWRGVVVEPLPAPFARLTSNYRWMRRVTTVNAAVGGATGTAEFFFVSPRPGDPWWTDQIGSFSRSHVVAHTDVPDVETRVARTEIPVMTLKDVCVRVGFERVDLVHLDVEGFDAELLQLLPYDDLQIRHLVFEHLHMADEVLARVKAHLLSLSFVPKAENAMDAYWSR